jgi:uncharacterized RDD family membrane protein YckC
LVNFTPNTDETVRPNGDVDPDIDPLIYPEFYDGIIFKRVIAYVIDVVAISIILGIVFVGLGLLGLVTFGVAWGIMGIVLFLIPFAYHTILIGGSQSATIGMRFMDLEVRRWIGGRPDYVQAAVQTILFYGSIALTAWLVLLVALFGDAGRCLHDYLSGTVVVNNLDELGSVDQFEEKATE